MTAPSRALALCGLAALGLIFAPYYRPSAIAARLRSSPDPGVAFDPAYGKFLEAVEKATPPTATIALIAPETSSPYAAQAAYRLAPRRVLDKTRSGESQFLAVYRRGTAPAAPPGAAALPGGFLLKP